MLTKMYNCYYLIRYDLFLLKGIFYYKTMHYYGICVDHSEIFRNKLGCELYQ